MSVISELVGGGGEAIGNMLVKVREAVTGKTILDQNEQAKISEQLSELADSLTSGQLKINEAEAQSTNWFVAGWRPFVGWVCGSAFAYHFLFFPFIKFCVYVWGSPETIKSLALLPELDLASLMPVLFGMLGLGGMRSWEKTKNAQNNH